MFFSAAISSSSISSSAKRRRGWREIGGYCCKTVSRRAARPAQGTPRQVICDRNSIHIYDIQYYESFILSCSPANHYRRSSLYFKECPIPRATESSCTFIATGEQQGWLKSEPSIPFTRYAWHLPSSLPAAAFPPMLAQRRFRALSLAYSTIPRPEARHRSPRASGPIQSLSVRPAMASRTASPRPPGRPAQAG